LLPARKVKRAKAKAKAAKANGTAKGKPVNGAKGKSTFSDYSRPQPGTSTYRPAPNAIAEDDFMASLLSAVAEPNAESSRKRKSSPDIPTSEPVEPSSDSSYFSANRKRYGIEDDDDSEVWDAKRGVMGKKPRVSELTVVPDRGAESDYSMEMDDEPIVVKPEPRDEEDDEIEIKPRAKTNGTTAPARQRKVINSTSVKHVKAEPVAAKVDTPTAKPRGPITNGKPLPAGAEHWSAVQDSLLPSKSSDIAEVKAFVGSVKAENVLEQDGSLRIFWLDHMEQDGIIHLVGKVLDRTTGRYVSACVSVNGIQRNLFVKPRTKRFCESCHLHYTVKCLIDEPAGTRQMSK
jgi:DNA polymerase alpha subunit A